MLPPLHDQFSFHHLTMSNTELKSALLTFNYYRSTISDRVSGGLDNREVYSKFTIHTLIHYYILITVEEEIIRQLVITFWKRIVLYVARNSFIIN